MKFSLNDIIPAKHRRRVYAFVTLATVLFGAWQASDGNWTTFVASILTALTTGMATANTAPPKTRNEDGAIDPGSLALGLVLGAVIIYAVLR